MADISANTGTENETELKMNRDMRYYQLHREKLVNKKKEKYNNDLEVIRKREERLKKKAEKEAEKEDKRIERERLKQEKLALAIATSQKKNIPA